MYSLNAKGKLLSLEKPIVMGILNLTHDSFYKGNMEGGMDELLATAGKMLADGATILDLGAQSTKPGSQRLSANEELKKLLPALKNMLTNFPEAIISIDTYHAAVAEKCVENGAAIINDISGGTLDESMITVVGKLKAPYVCMHIQGRPETMHLNPQYEDPVREIITWFTKKIEHCHHAGIKDLILDPGFGFGKNIDHNFEILSKAELFQVLHKPILVGLSRKSTIYKTLKTSPENALNGTTVLNTIALQKGANILRVHDVKEAVECIELLGHLNKKGRSYG